MFPILYSALSWVRRVLFGLVLVLQSMLKERMEYSYVFHAIECYENMGLVHQKLVAW